jgi:hypothetical protein
MANIFVAATATFNGKALARGKKEISAFDKQVKKLGRTFGITFSAAALLNYSKKAVAAFAADEKAAKALEQQLKNTGYQFSAPGVENYISNLQKTSGVLDDELRPAFQQLLTVTKSITQSQDALSTALNVSAATGASLSEVSAAIAKGYSGQTTSLSRLNAGLSKAVLKTGDMEKIMAELNKKFAGQSAARLTTYAGKMDLLKVASENVKEEIGKGILGALDALSKDKSIEDTTTKMEDFGKTTGDAITGVGLLIAELEKIPGSRKISDILFGTNIFGLLGKLAEEDRKSKAGTKANLEPRSSSRVYVQQLRLENKIIKDTNKARADELAKLKAKSEVDKLAEKFDVERIGLLKALNEATDADTKLRILSKIAILDNNEALAKKYNAELNAKTAVDILATAATVAAGSLNSLANGMPALFNSLGELTARGRNQLAPLEDSKYYAVPQGATNQAAQSAAATPTQATLTLDPNASSDKLVQAIGDMVLVSLKYGNKLIPVGSI